MTTRAYLIECLTNMHVGVGGANYDIVSNAVQRDVTTGLPTIFSSSLKGALKEYCNHSELDKKYINYIFGPDSEDGSDIGHYKILPADLLSLPVRSKEIPYYNATANDLVKHINGIANAFGKNTIINFDESAEVQNPKTQKENEHLEDYHSVGGLNTTNEYIGDNIAVFHYKDLKYLADNLPVVARNRVEGTGGLWHEEVIPKASRFVFFVKIDDNDKERIKAFEKTIIEKPVQIGANGSVGYGYCKISKIDKL